MVTPDSSIVPFVLAVILTPLLASWLCALIRDRISWVAPIIASVLQLISVILALILFVNLTSDAEFTTPWLTLPTSAIHIGFSINRLVLTMLVVVAVISFLVHLFSIGYMADDDAVAGYFSRLSFFTFAMMGLVLSNNLLVLFCFWELVGYSSYRLIGHWHERPSAAKAATKAFMITKAGDLGFLMGVLLLWSSTGSLEISSLSLSETNTTLMTAAGLCIFIGVMGKSAQFPLFNWLPDAMEGPTPVSALIHAATMVAAGVYLLIRLEPMFTPLCLTVMTGIGAITALLGALGALVQFDIKKILAYSTISQLGLMVMAMGSESAQGGYEHLLHHAFFKAGLFLGAGSILHAAHQALHHEHDVDVQDIRNLGGLKATMPITFFCFLICAAALAGLPFTSGFISKEIILTQITASSSVVSVVAWVVSFLTAIYSFRLVWYVFYKSPAIHLPVVEAPVIMRTATIVLSAGSISFLWFEGKLSTLTHVMLQGSYHVPFSIATASILVVLFGLATGYLLFRNKPTQSWTWIEPQFYLDWISTQWVTIAKALASVTSYWDRAWIDRVLHGLVYLQVAAAYLTQWIDTTLVDGVVNGSSATVRGVGWAFRTAVNGKIQSYLLWAMAALVIFILWTLY